MSRSSKIKKPLLSFLLKGIAGSLIFALVSGTATSQVIWTGDFSTGDLTQFHQPENAGSVAVWGVPEYGRPIQYGKQLSAHVGNGDLLSLVSADGRTVNNIHYPRGPTRGSAYAAKFTIKNSKNGTETADCDPTGGGNCTRRRSQIVVPHKFYKAIPQLAERWVSLSVFLPSDFDPSGSGFHPVIWGSKAHGQNSGSGWAGLKATTDGWEFTHRYNNESPNGKADWWWNVNYNSTYPSSSKWPQGLVDFPNETASKTALRNLNKGGWTDFVLHFKTDPRPHKDNVGFLNLYMRAGTGDWVHVLNILPMKDVNQGGINNPERWYDRGVGRGGTTSEYTSVIGLYTAKERVWNKSSNMTIYLANHKIGSQNARFSDLSPDGSSFGGGPSQQEAPPKAPALIVE